MRFTYDSDVDVLMVRLRARKEGEKARSKEISDGVIVDFDAGGHPIAFEILGAAERYGQEAMRPFDINHRLLTLAEAAEISGLSAGTLKNLAADGRLTAQKVGKTWVTTEASLREYLNSRKYNAKDFGPVEIPGQHEPMPGRPIVPLSAMADAAEPPTPGAKRRIPHRAAKAHA